MEGYEALYEVSTWAWLFGSIGTTIFPILYAFSNWTQRFVGRALMLQSVSVAIAVDFTTLLHFFPQLGLTMALAWLNLLMPVFLGLSALCLTGLMWELNHPLPMKRKAHEQQDV